MDRKTAVRATGSAAALLALTGLGLTAPASAGDRRSSVVQVVASADGLTLSRSEVRSSWVTLDLDVTHRGAASLQVLRLRKGVTVPELLANLSDDDAAAGTRALDAGATFHGGIDVNAGQDDASVTMRLERGKDVVLDLQPFFEGRQATVRTLEVTGNSGRGGAPKADARVEMDELHGGHGTHGHVFEAPDVLPAAGRVDRNQNEVVHFAQMVPVKPGTTDAQVQAAFEAGPGAPGPFFEQERDYAGMNVLSAGERASLTYDLPRGTYVLLCFVSDEVNGVPHAVLGMHKVVQLR